jgi:DNA primase large subunit
LLTRADLAKYPFVAEASEYVRELGFSIDEIASPEFSPVIDRAEKRLEEAFSKGRVSPNIADENVEILSFPVSNLILSFTGEDRARRRVALAEAKRAHDLLLQESPEKLEYIATRDFLWKIVRIDNTIGGKLYEFSLALADYLRNSVRIKEPRWKLSNRILYHGSVYVTRVDVARLLEEEVRARLSRRRETVGGVAPKFLQPKIEQAKQLIVKFLGVPSQFELPRVPVPEAMPPCVKHVIEELDVGKNVPHMGRFALASFLLNIGAEEEEVVRLFKPASDFSERMTRYQVEHIAGKRGGKVKYTCPNCDTLKTHGVCYKPDGVCATIQNPLSYYKKQARAIAGRGPRRGPR